MNLRNIAYKIIYAVKYDKKYSNIVINETFNSFNLSDEEKNFTTYLVYGVLSNIYYLDYFIKKYSSIAFSKISKQSRIILEIALFEIIFMNSATNYASVNEAVTLSKKYDNRAKSFINALLRKFTSTPQNMQSAKEHSFDDIKNINEKISIKYSVSLDIVDRLLSNYEYDFVCDLLNSMSKTPCIFIRANTLKCDFEKISSILSEQKVNYEIVDKKHMIFSVKNLKNIENNILYKNGLISIQDYASMLSVLALEPQKNEKILDLCAAPGGKSIFISQLMDNKGSVTSLDISQSKLDLLKEQSKRLSIDIITTQINDGTILNNNYVDKFDRVLADVPCSGIGILRRKPEIRYKTLNDIQDLLIIQEKILDNASKYVKTNGILVYSTCTLGKQENENQINSFIKTNPNFKVMSMKEYYPHIDNTDGFFICKLMKSPN